MSARLSPRARSLLQQSEIDFGNQRPRRATISVPRSEELTSKEKRREATTEEFGEVDLVKKPKPSPPQGAPASRVWLGSPMAWFALGIEITADDLRPDEITSVLGLSPTHQHERGQLTFKKDGTPRRPPKFGRWAFHHESDETDEWNANEATKRFLDKFKADPIVWNTISSTATVRLTLALFLEDANQGLSLDPDVLRWLADRNIRLDVDVYEGDSEPKAGHAWDRETSH